ncbi:MAG: YqiA/YcfP family alpha/beta fold hydrolase [Thalassotalea sp.]|nr:YqiA/YcfP family alpha/beta fold hydrolase [Thalassotalea sp.]MDG2393366.1 YqiA/YcfP family alpha/beta fold hydrolase [Thalassotalea sp.]
MSKKKILVIHGFNSSPQSLKAQLTVQYMQDNYPEIDVVVPQLLSTPELAIKQLCQIIEAENNIDWYFTGSSLGGYFATYLVSKYKRPAVLINPAVTPYLLLADYIGEQENPYTGEVYQVTKEHMQQLKLIESEICQQKMFFVMVQTGDEVLDYQQAVAKYGNCKLEVQQGGDHSFINFEQMLPKISSFFQF